MRGDFRRPRDFALVDGVARAPISRQLRGIGPARHRVPGNPTTVLLYPDRTRRTGPYSCYDRRRPGHFWAHERRLPGILFREGCEAVGAEACPRGRDGVVPPDLPPLPHDQRNRKRSRTNDAPRVGGGSLPTSRLCDHGHVIWWALAASPVVRCADAFAGCVFIFITSSAPNKRSLGATNGIAQLVAALVRALGPASATSLFAVSLEHNWLGGYGVYAILMAVSCALLSVSMPLPREAWTKNDTR